MTPSAALLYWLSHAVVTSFLLTGALCALLYVSVLIARALHRRLSQRTPD